MSGITIGDGVVIANNSHVVKNVESYSLVGGNPAKLIKYRFTQEQINKLLEIKWWNWDDEKINEHLLLMCSTNIDDFINSVYQK
jgi:virginiamycin A acetyltransferase